MTNAKLGSRRPLLIYDETCPLCQNWVARCRRMTGDSVSYVAAQKMLNECPVPRGDLAQAVHLVEPGGRVAKGAEAIVRLLVLAGRSRLPLWLYRNVPGFSRVMEFIYRLVARHRHRL